MNPLTIITLAVFGLMALAVAAWVYVELMKKYGNLR